VSDRDVGDQLVKGSLQFERGPPSLRGSVQPDEALRELGFSDHRFRDVEVDGGALVGQVCLQSRQLDDDEPSMPCAAVFRRTGVAGARIERDKVAAADLVVLVPPGQDVSAAVRNTKHVLAKGIDAIGRRHAAHPQQRVVVARAPGLDDLLIPQGRTSRRVVGSRTVGVDAHHAHHCRRRRPGC